MGTKSYASKQDIMLLPFSDHCCESLQENGYDADTTKDTKTRTSIHNNMQQKTSRSMIHSSAIRKKNVAAQTLRGDTKLRGKKEGKKRSNKDKRLIQVSSNRERFCIDFTLYSHCSTF